MQTQIPLAVASDLVFDSMPAHVGDEDARKKFSGKGMDKLEAVIKQHCACASPHSFHTIAA